MVYGSDRIDGNTPVRDACAVSNLDKQQLVNFDFSQTMAKFKTIQTMKDNGMRGKFNGYTKKEHLGTMILEQLAFAAKRAAKNTNQNRLPIILRLKNQRKRFIAFLYHAIEPYSRILGMLDENSP